MINKKILIIGGTGALGKELTKRYQKDNEIIIFSRDEHKHVMMSKENWIDEKVKFRIGDIKDKDSIRDVIEVYKPQIIINTAALKHVPICENNPFESVNVNVIGHQNLIQMVSRANHRIETLIFVSTDKACKPINVYGMGKAISERLYIEYANQQTDVKVCILRYGNVLESTGSVIPLFKKLLDQGITNLPITDIKMTRFLLTLTNAIELIEWTYNNDTHGKIVIPKVDSFYITAIAEALLKSKGVSGDFKIIGIRPGEKLHEELISDIEWARTIDSGEHYLITDNVIKNEFKSYNSFDSLIESDKAYLFLKENGVI